MLAVRGPQTSTLPGFSTKLQVQIADSQRFLRRAFYRPELLQIIIVRRSPVELGHKVPFPPHPTTWGATPPLPPLVERSSQALALTHPGTARTVTWLR